MIRSKRFLAIGCTLVVFALFGFFTVADDFRHVGELIGVVSLLLAGLALIAAGFYNPVSRNLAVEWLAAGFLFGALIGAILDDMCLGVSIGTLVGLALAVRFRGRTQIAIASGNDDPHR